MKNVTKKLRRSLETIYRDAGLPCELEAGSVGIVVYAASAAIAATVANGLARGPRSFGVEVEVEAPVFAKDENPAAAYVATVRFDWDAMPRSSTDCVQSLAQVSK